MSIDIYMDYVVVEGQVVKRPDYISRKVWMDQWEVASFRVKQGCRRYDCPNG